MLYELLNMACSVLPMTRNLTLIVLRLSSLTFNFVVWKWWFVACLLIALLFDIIITRKILVDILVIWEQVFYIVVTLRVLIGLRNRAHFPLLRLGYLALIIPVTLCAHTLVVDVGAQPILVGLRRSLLGCCADSLVSNLAVYGRILGAVLIFRSVILISSVHEFPIYSAVISSICIWNQIHVLLVLLLLN